MEDEVDHNNMPIITLEVMTEMETKDMILSDLVPDETQVIASEEEPSRDSNNPGVHFLTDPPEDNPPKAESDREQSQESSKARSDLLEYMMRNDGSVICKLCGEILQSRTHWYRHKYKLHVIQPLNPAPLFQCEQCLVYFKSRKGYIGHLSSRHSESLSDSSPVLSNSQIEASVIETVPTQILSEVKEEPDPELSIPKTSVPNYQINKQTATKGTEMKRASKIIKDVSTKAEWEERRSREEKLVSDIIDRVRRECEAQGSGGSTRRGYTRRTTVMHT